ncbi:MAG: hypothetical protein ACREQY_04830, partial [Candidatus Binatia bacterium]
WDEALNPSHLSPGLAKFLGTKLSSLCADYRTAPERFVAAHGAELAARYALIGLRERIEFRMDRVCAEEAGGHLAGEASRPVSP